MNDTECASLSSSLPANAVTPAHIEVLDRAGWLHEVNADGTHWLGYGECPVDFSDDASDMSELEIDKWDKDDAFTRKVRAHIDGTAKFVDQIWLEVFGDMLQRVSVEELPFIEYEGAYQASSLGAGQNGGFVTRIYRDRIEGRGTQTIRMDWEDEDARVLAVENVHDVLSKLLRTPAALQSLDLGQVEKTNASLAILHDWISNHPLIKDGDEEPAAKAA